jgi:hypothetical protein
MNTRTRHYVFRAFTVILLVMALSRGDAIASKISNYRIFFGGLYTVEKKIARIALRRFSTKGSEYYLAVDPVTLKTEIIPVGKYLLLKMTLPEIRKRYGTCPYVKALDYAARNSRRLQNAGITHCTEPSGAAYVTADLCPTKLPMDRSFFTTLLSGYGAYDRPVHIALAVTGLWLENHPDDVRWILSRERNGSLSITWINHSYRHRYRKRCPLWKNFLLDMSSNVEEEIMLNEKAMIGAGLVPSVLFRFPGLVSSAAVFERVTDRGLIPLGSDAWLGKNQWPAAGSIILVHANGQEPVGIKRFGYLLQTKSGDIAAGRWRFRGIVDGIRDMMKMN